ncbi:uncharacterized protein LOC110863371 [Folsomia candida]|uniref:Large ribosomal subunit protein bL36m n=1 Tax=Folsomia candida TaxID=158441 RepID=A0A226F2K1_FOLCA|nr:uncharacterized protein LOC110863371 [Folsomia candida]OXA63644.1 hypothetical protein Fcan01_03210 [Folsomia candida]
MWSAIIRKVAQKTQCVVQGSISTKLQPQLLTTSQLSHVPPISCHQNLLMSTCSSSWNYSMWKSSAVSFLSNCTSPSLSSPPPVSSPSPMFGGLLIVPSRGMKIKGRVKRRCKDCYMIWIDGVLHNKCKTHPRHTQKQKEKYWANTRLLTHASMSPKRPW